MGKASKTRKANKKRTTNQQPKHQLKPYGPSHLTVQGKAAWRLRRNAVFYMKKMGRGPLPTAIPRSVMYRIFREMLQNRNGRDYRLKQKAAEILHAFIETKMIWVMFILGLLAMHAKRCTIKVADLEMAKSLNLIPNQRGSENEFSIMGGTGNWKKNLHNVVIKFDP